MDVTLLLTGDFLHGGMNLLQDVPRAVIDRGASSTRFTDASTGLTRALTSRWETGSARPRGPALRFVQLWIAEMLGEEVSLGT